VIAACIYLAGGGVDLVVDPDLALAAVEGKRYDLLVWGVSLRNVAPSGGDR
jgi:hypothetical protein